MRGTVARRLRKIAAKAVETGVIKNTSISKKSSMRGTGLKYIGYRRFYKELKKAHHS